VRASRLVLVSVVACSGPGLDAREATLASTLARADETLIRARPALVAGKYADMAGSTYDWYRGSLAVYARDWQDDATSVLASSAFALDAPLVLANGDPHVENFGALIAADGSIAIEENDFDSADYYPYLYDLRRFLVGLVVATYASNSDDPAAQEAAIAARRDVARAGAASYAAAIAALAAGGPATRVTSAGSDPILEDVLSRSHADAATRSELGSLTTLSGTTRTLIRGAIDPTVPDNTLSDLPAYDQAALAEALAEYTQTLESPPPPEFFTVLDAARELGAGVASWPRVRALVLVRGPSDDPSDDVVLEVKEEADSGAGFYPPYVYFDSVQARVTGTSRAIWRGASASPLWGASTWVGFPVQVRLESDGQKGVKTKRFTGSRGTVAALIALASDLGALLARVHATPSPVSDDPAGAIAARIASDPEGFADEQANVALSYGDRAFADYARFQHVLDVLGPRLGVPLDPSDAPSPDLAALFGSP